MINNKKPSIRDIADIANVSIATVSRVLNNSDKVKTETAERVLKAADDLNYHPDKVARRMRVKNTDALIFGLIITDVGNPFFSDLSRGVEDIAYKNKHTVLICNSDEDPEKEELYINSMISEKVSGIIIAPTAGNSMYLKKLASNGFPIVCVDRKLKNLDSDSVIINNELGAYQATEHLIKLGHSRIGIISGIEGLSTTKKRFTGYKNALSHHNLKVYGDLVVHGNYKADGGRRAMRKLLELEIPPTAVFSTNNLMTLGGIEEIYRYNLAIPGDVALTGFDDMSWSDALNPPLTAVRQPGYKLGTKAAELLMRRLENPDISIETVTLDPQLIIRKSCGSGE